MYRLNQTKLADFVFREALPEDKEAVLGIREVYHGCDYLHHRYDEFQNSSNIASYLCKVNGEVVGFVSMIIVDNGETAINRAARVRQDFEGKGVYRFLLSEVDKIHKKQGLVKRHALSTRYKMPYPNQLCMERVLNTYTFTIEPCDNKATEPSHASTDIQLSDELPIYVFQPPYATYLFPHNRIMIEGVPCRLFQSNIPLLPKSIFSSTLKETSDGKVSGLLSAFSSYKGTKEYDIVCNLDVYGTDFETLKNHVAVYLKYLHENVKAHVILSCIFDKNVEACAPEKVFNKFGIEKLVFGPLSCQTHFLYERNIVQLQTLSL